MKEDNEEILLARWLEGTITDEELSLLKKEGSLTDLESFLERMKGYNYEAMDENQVWEEITQKKPVQKKKKRLIIPLWSRIAASILIVFTATWIWNGSNGTTVRTEYAEKTEIILPNNSIVTLNAGSKLRYFEKDWDNNRLMQLEGEAFFKVSKGKSFIVNSSIGDVKVLGTQFNIYNRNDLFMVTCYEGSVLVSFKNEIDNVILKKGESVQLKNGDLIKKNVNTDKPQWISGIFEFSKLPLEVVFNEIERQYDLNIEFINVDLSRQYTGEFLLQDIKGSLDRVCGAMNLRYEIGPKTKNIKIFSNNK